MTIYFNNQSINTKCVTLLSLIEEKMLVEKSGLAIALNEEVVPKSEWSDKELAENDRVLVITATQGG